MCRRNEVGIVEMVVIVLRSSSKPKKNGSELP